MLGVARSLASSRVQLVGINHGRLGFITDISLADWRTALSAILDGVYDAEDRILLSARALRDGPEIWHDICLNDVVVSRSSRSGMIELQVDVDGVYMYNQRADGLIVATPTGSTAYALSAGGPILAPDVPGFTIVPVCPHSLTARPLVVSDRSIVKISMSNCYDGAVLSVDGRKGIPLLLGDEILLSRSAHLTRLIKYSHGFFDKLRTKLHWGGKPVG
ncbi:MAG TPA: NAD kinase [Cyanobacteria bacterium UBA8530]|nr:NAD kinase [Cyanobacteria bacterium UBA8530]